MISINSGSIYGRLYLTADGIRKEFESGESLPLKITGSLIQAQEGPSKRIKIPVSELQNCSNSALGKQILANHSTSVFKVCGKIVRTWVDGLKVKFEGLIYNSEIAQLIRNNLLNSVSPALEFKRLICGTCGKIYRSCSHKGNAIAQGLSVKNLAIVLNPAIKSSTFKASLSETLNGIIDLIDRFKPKPLSFSTPESDYLLRSLIDLEENKSQALEVFLSEANDIEKVFGIKKKPDILVKKIGEALEKYEEKHPYNPEAEAEHARQKAEMLARLKRMGW